MADIIIGRDIDPSRLYSESDARDKLWSGPSESCWIGGRKGTFAVVRDGEDVIASAGYVRRPNSSSMEETLKEILEAFKETDIPKLKQELAGQFLLAVKKGGNSYIFSDFMGARNLFYSDGGRVVSSSYARAEALCGIGPEDLDTGKILEFLGVRHILYPAWLGPSTAHKRIQWLLPYEYLALDIPKSAARIGTVSYDIENAREPRLPALADSLLECLSGTLSCKEFETAKTAASLSGGRDSRLVAAVAAERFRDLHFRTAFAPGHFDSMSDLGVAKKLAKIRNVPLDVYEFRPGRDEETFREFTESFSPEFNSKLAPLLAAAGSYALGFGGIFGTEMFMPIPWPSIREFIRIRVERARQFLEAGDPFWKTLRDSLMDEFGRLKSHYRLSAGDDRHHIRLFLLQNTARYGSFIISAFNREGYQLEPYGQYAVLNIALRVPPELWGNAKRFGGDAHVQQAAMAKWNKSLARVLTYKNFRPMLPLSLASFPRYVGGALRQGTDVLRRKFDKTLKNRVATELPGGRYVSDGWEQRFLGRFREAYGLAPKTHGEER
jgi:hypothetical protein